MTLHDIAVVADMVPVGDRTTTIAAVCRCTRQILEMTPLGDRITTLVAGALSGAYVDAHDDRTKLNHAAAAIQVVINKLIEVRVAIGNHKPHLDPATVAANAIGRGLFTAELESALDKHKGDSYTGLQHKLTEAWEKYRNAVGHLRVGAVMAEIDAIRIALAVRAIPPADLPSS